MKFTYFRLGLIVLLSTTLLACGGSGSKKPDYTAPETPTEEETPRVPDVDEGDCFGTDCDDSDYEGGSGSDDGQGGTTVDPDDETPLPDNLLPLPEDSAPSQNLLGNSSDSATYGFDQYLTSEVTTGSDLSGTWVATHKSGSAAEKFSSRNFHKYVFVIKKDTTVGADNAYQAANCSGLTNVIREVEVTCVNGAGNVVDCSSAGSRPLAPLILKEEYQPWASFIKTTTTSTVEIVDEETEDASEISTTRIDLPLFTPSLWRTEKGISFKVIGDTWSRMESSTGQYQAVKISESTNALGTSKINIRNGVTESHGEPEVFCTTQVKAILNNKSGENTTTNYLSSLYLATDNDLQLAITTEDKDGQQPFLLKRFYVVEGDITFDKEGGKYVYDQSTKPGSYDGLSEGNISLKTLESIDNSQIKLDLEMQNSAAVPSTLESDITIP